MIVVFKAKGLGQTYLYSWPIIFYNRQYAYMQSSVGLYGNSSIRQSKGISVRVYMHLRESIQYIPYFYFN